MALTERQQQIKDLMEQGQKPDEIAKKLGITTNAIYQQLRRMRGGAKKTGRKSARKPQAPARGGSRLPAAPPAPAPAHITPLQAVRARRDEIKHEVRDCDQAVAAARRALDAAIAQSEKVAARHKEELKALDKAEAVLRPQASSNGSSPPAKKPASRGKSAPPATSGGTGGNGVASTTQTGAQGASVS
jgi:IS30 family transposase